ncbi:hypothetical protein GCM10022254_31720 [Actinomadura meridiana]|uniref:Uncharacterized protein n=1 Tax=Actinomadura meridiana TaxID=559626 RepID=A0ABP8C240_9ACTN
MTHKDPEFRRGLRGVDAHEGTEGEQASTDTRFDQLRAAFPGWGISYTEDEPVPWIAIRKRRPGWLGGHPVAEAIDPGQLRRLIAQAVETGAKVHTWTARGAQAEQTRRPDHAELCVR